MKKIIIYSFFFIFPLIIWIESSHAGVFSKDAERYRQEGYLAQQKGDIDSAIEWYQKAATLEPNYVAPHNDLGILFETKGWLDRAEGEYKKALAIDPNYKEAHTNLALLYERKGELEKASFHWMRRYKLGTPDEPWTREAMERLRKIGLLDAEGKKPVEKPKEKPKSKPPKLSQWSRTGSRSRPIAKPVTPKKTQKVSRKRKPSIEEELDESLRLAEERLRREYSRKDSQKQTETKVIKAPEAKIAPAPAPTAASYSRAKDYYQKGEYSRALDAIRVAKKDFPNDTSLASLEEDVKNKMKEERINDHYSEGMMHYRQKDYKGARKEFEAILSILPE